MENSSFLDNDNPSNLWFTVDVTVTLVVNRGFLSQQIGGSLVNGNAAAFVES